MQSTRVPTHEMIEWRLTGPDKIEPWIGLTGELAPYLGIPPSKSRLIPTPGTLKVPLTPVGQVGSE